MSAAPKPEPVPPTVRLAERLARLGRTWHAAVAPKPDRVYPHRNGNKKPRPANQRPGLFFGSTRYLAPDLAWQAFPQSPCCLNQALDCGQIRLALFCVHFGRKASRCVVQFFAGGFVALDQVCGRIGRARLRGAPCRCDGRSESKCCQRGDSDPHPSSICLHFVSSPCLAKAISSPGPIRARFPSRHQTRTPGARIIPSSRERFRPNQKPHKRARRKHTRYRTDHELNCAFHRLRPPFSYALELTGPRNLARP